MKRKIWALIKDSGGEPQRVISTEVPVLEQKLYKGFHFFSFLTQEGNMRVAEANTGSIVAVSFEELYENMEGVSEAVLQEQLDRTSPVMGSAENVTFDQFFELYNH